MQKFLCAKILLRYDFAAFNLPGIVTMDNIAGSPVEGSNFFGRHADIDRIREWLLNHDVLLLGPRRIGKTSVARAVMRAMREAGWRAIENVRGLPGADKVRWLVSGSVGLDTLVQQHGMADTINSLKHVGLPPFTEEEASAMLVALAAEYRLSLALLAQAAATREGSRADSLLTMLHGRIPDATEEQARLAFIRLRDILQRDAYWTPDDFSGARRYRFMLEPLRRWWLRRSTL